MGQKVHPTGIRLGVVKDHNSVWYADSQTYAQNLINEDMVGHKLGEFAVTRTFKGHIVDKKAKR